MPELNATYLSSDDDILVQQGAGDGVLCLQHNPIQLLGGVDIGQQIVQSGLL